MAVECPIIPSPPRQPRPPAVEYSSPERRAARHAQDLLNLSNLDIDGLPAGSVVRENAINAALEAMVDQLNENSSYEHIKWNNANRTQAAEVWIQRMMPVLNDAAFDNTVYSAARNANRKAIASGENIIELYNASVRKAAEANPIYIGAQLATVNDMRAVEQAIFDIVMPKTGAVARARNRFEVWRLVNDVQQNLSRMNIDPNIGADTAAKAHMEATANAAIERARQGFGLSEEGMTALKTEVGKLADAYHGRMLLAKRFNVKANVMQDYTPRMRTAWYERLRLDAVRKSDGSKWFKKGGASNDDLREAFQRSRNTNVFLVEDELLLASNLGMVKFDPERIEELRKLKGVGAQRTELERLIGNAEFDAATTKRQAEELNDIFTIAARENDAYVETKAQWKRQADVVSDYDKRVARLGRERQALLDKKNVDVEAVAQKDDAIRTLRQQQVEARADADALQVELTEYNNTAKELDRARKAQDRARKKAKAARDELNKQRKLFAGLPEGDEVALAEQLLDESLANAQAELADWITDRRLRVEAFNNMSDDQLESLADAQILSKLPMTEEEELRYFAERWGGGGPKMADLFVLDPIRRLEMYDQQMQRAVGRSNALREMGYHAKAGGWGVDERIINQANVSGDPRYRGWRKITDAELDQFGIDKTIPGIKDTYFDPQILETQIITWKMQADPLVLGTNQTWLNTIDRMVRQQFLGTTGFLFRQAQQVFLSYGASGGNLGTLPITYIKWRKITDGGQDAAKVLDNTARIYTKDGLTELELYYKFLGTGQSQNAAAQVGLLVPKTKSNYSPFNPANHARSIKRWADSLAVPEGLMPGKNFGERFRYSQVAEGPLNFLADSTGEISGRIMHEAAAMEQASKFAALKSITSQNAMTGAGQFVSGLAAGSTRRFQFYDVDAAMNHLSDYFFDYNNQGLADKFLKKFAPFWSFQSRNPIATLRIMQRNPRRFINVQRLYALFNRDAESEGLEVGGIKEYQQGLGMQYVTVNGRQFAIPWNQIGAFEEGFNTLRGQAEFLDRWLLGRIDQRGPEAQAKSVMGEDSMLGEVLGGLGSGMYGTSEAALKLGMTTLKLIKGDKKGLTKGEMLPSGYQPAPTLQEGDRFNVLGASFGWRWSPQVWDIMTTLVPYFEQADKFNPPVVPTSEGMQRPFGQQQVVDPRTGEVLIEGYQSILGNERARTEESAEKFIVDRITPGWHKLTRRQQVLISGLQAVGVNIRELDTFKGLSKFDGTLKRNVKDLERKQRDIDKKVEELKDADDGKSLALLKQYDKQWSQLEAAKIIMQGGAEAIYEKYPEIREADKKRKGRKRKNRLSASEAVELLNLDVK